MQNRIAVCASVSIVSLTLSLAVPVADAGHRRNRCCPEQQECCPAQQTQLVPEWTTETRTVQCTESRIERRTHKYCVSRPVWEERDQTYTVMVPHQETRTAT